MNQARWWVDLFGDFISIIISAQYEVRQSFCPAFPVIHQPQHPTSLFAFDFFHLTLGRSSGGIKLCGSVDSTPGQVSHAPQPRYQEPGLRVPRELSAPSSKATSKIETPHGAMKIRPASGARTWGPSIAGADKSLIGQHIHYSHPSMRFKIDAWFHLSRRNNLY
ncbi:uncharacterized protein BDR25DRAFT_351998 [Lindgomyces ingoldianus]|uniref:Uncharacterized protein n=1 Tax=Lindgomyces ingoldianus TaxID=673940 RepID=A0ACB6R7E7_9PLEO|nr:uncharacterized protein BDR25DRAFT_351998 [Lindgomyces ingoldianus]KAF2474447.1 hypothetical protein BDR25DRAFT_351998 [Lindgomyces ingoldianus]